MPPLAKVAVRLGMTERAVQVVAHRDRARHRWTLLGRIGGTDADVAEIEEEARDLFAGAASRDGLAGNNPLYFRTSFLPSHIDR